MNETRRQVHKETDSMLDLRCCDNMELMREFPDKHFDLAIVDPPYGLNKKITGGHFEIYGNKQSDWDKIPDDKYFKELRRVSKNQIIWGGNYFPVLWEKGCRGIIFWDKKRAVDNFSAGELAYSSFDTNCKIARIPYDGFIGMDAGRFHPTQKPIKLYSWIISNYAKKGDKILDTHLGSGSIAIACHDYGFDLTACELDKDYYEAAMKRINAHVAQQKLFV